MYAFFLVCLDTYKKNALTLLQMVYAWERSTSIPHNDNIILYVSNTVLWYGRTGVCLTKAPFRSKNFWILATVALSFVFGN